MAARAARNLDLDLNAPRVDLDAPRVDPNARGLEFEAPDVNAARGLEGLGGSATAASRSGLWQSFRNLPGVKQIGDKFAGLRKTDVNRASADAASVRPKADATPVPEAKQREVVENNVDIESPDGKTALKNADDLAAKPEVSKTLSKWGLRGGIGVMFLMLLYKKNNPIDAIEEAGDDALEGIKGLSEFLNSIFEAFKTLLQFLTQNWMVSSASSCCCLLLITLPMLMNATRSIAPSRPRFGGAYY
jgi:hypothetical protein